MSFRLWLCDSLHLLSHAIAPTRYECLCYQAAWLRSLKVQRDAELRAIARSPEELRQWQRFEQWMRENAA